MRKTCHNRVALYVWLSIGPLLFLLFINDLPLLLHDTVSFVDLYADDTTLYEQHSDLKTLQRNLQKSLNLLHDWCRKKRYGIKYIEDESNVDHK